MYAAKAMHAERDTPPLAGWCVIYRPRDSTAPALQVAADQQAAESIADQLLDSVDEIVAVCAAEDLYQLPGSLG
jgi:hypothetical protein